MLKYLKSKLGISDDFQSITVKGDNNTVLQTSGTDKYGTTTTVTVRNNDDGTTTRETRVVDKNNNITVQSTRRVE